MLVTDRKNGELVIIKHGDDKIEVKLFNISTTICNMHSVPRIEQTPT